MFVPNFKILGKVVPEKSLTKKKVYTHTEKAKTIYPLYTSYTVGIITKKKVAVTFCLLSIIAPCSSHEDNTPDLLKGTPINK